MPNLKIVSAVSLKRGSVVYDFPGATSPVVVTGFRVLEPADKDLPMPIVEILAMHISGDNKYFYHQCPADSIFDVDVISSDDLNDLITNAQIADGELRERIDSGTLSVADHNLSCEMAAARKYDRDSVNQVHFDAPSIREEKMSAGAAITGDLPISSPEPDRIDACDILHECRKLIIQRGEQNGYDDGRERSAAKIAAVFNALKGTSLSEKDVWDLLLVLKLVRAQTSTGNDSRRDLVSYAALGAECSENGVSK